MNVYEMRMYITKAYPGKKWKERCKAMKTNQVVAVYYSLLTRDRDKEKQAEGYSKLGRMVLNTAANTNTLQAIKGEEGIQMTIFDYL